MLEFYSVELNLAIGVTCIFSLFVILQVEFLLSRGRKGLVIQWSTSKLMKGALTLPRTSIKLDAWGLSQDNPKFVDDSPTKST